MLAESGPIPYPRAVETAGQKELSWIIAISASLCLSVSAAEDANTDTGGAKAGPEATARSSVVKILSPAQWGEDYQVRAFGSEPYTRAVFVSYARELRDDFRNLVYRYREHSAINRHEWAIPIRIELRGAPENVYKGDDVRRRTVIGPDNRFVIYVYVMLHDGFEEDSFRKEMISALLMEQMLMPFAEYPSNLPVNEVKTPSWLVQGFDQMIEHRRGGRPSAFYQGFLDSGQMLDPEVILTTEIDENIDPVNLAIFRASSSALMEALLDQDDGDIAMRSLLGDLAVTDGDKTGVLLRQHFPALREIDEGLDKWWALQVAALGQQQGYEFFDWEETEYWLDEALKIEFEETSTMLRAEPVKTGFLERLRPKKTDAASATQEAFSGSIADYATFIKRPGAEEKLIIAFNKLERLKRTGFPAYRPLITAYEAIVLKIKDGDMKTVDEELQTVSEMRAKIGETLEQAEDYMNFFEATRAPQRSQAFDDYLEMRRKLEERKPPRRNDRISRYLDSLEREFR